MYASLLLSLGLLVPSPYYFGAGASLLAYYFLSVGYVLYAIRHLDVSRRCPPNAFEEEDSTVELRLIHSGWFPLLGVELLDNFSPQSISQVRLLVPERLAPRSIYALSYLGQCFKKRGTYDVGPIEVRIWDPLGLVRARRVLPVYDRIVVYPAPVPVASPAAAGSRLAVGTGVEWRVRAGLSPIYRGARDYLPGDDPRLVHWPLSARHGRLLVREFDAELHPAITIFLDLEKANQRGLGGCSTLEYQVKIAASLAADAVRRRVRVSMIGESDRTIEVPPGSTRRHLALVLEELVAVKMEGSVRFFHLVRTEVHRLSRGSTVVLLLASPPQEDEEFVDLAGRLVARGHRVSAYLFDRETFPAVTEAERERGSRPPADDFARALHDQGVEVRVVSGRVPLPEQLLERWSPPAPPASVAAERSRRARW